MFQFLMHTYKQHNALHYVSVYFEKTKDKHKKNQASRFQFVNGN